eukprot:3504328-Pyramimonas_sp.AAC.1
MDDRLASRRVSTPWQVCPANAIAFDLVIGIAVQATAAKIAMQINLALWCHRLINYSLRAGLQLP